MTVLKHRGQVYGAKFTAAEQKALDIEIRRGVVEMIDEKRLDLQAEILWVLHSEFGYGKERLRRFYDIYDKSLDEVVKRYALEEKSDETAGVCIQKLKDYGVDLEAWRKGEGI